MSKTRRKSVGQKERVASNLFTFIGTIPILAISLLSSYLLYCDYKNNNYSFMMKNKFYSNSNPNEMFENLTRPDIQKNDLICARFFSDYIIDEDE